MTTIIQTQHLQFSYGQQAVLNDITMSIQAGEIIGLIGENGAGKTTLLNLLLGTLPAKSGTVKIFGTQPGSAVAKSKIGAMHQGNLVIAGVTVRELVTLMAQQVAKPQAVSAVLQQLELTSIAKRRLNTLSGGQIRRVMAAAALVNNPDLLFLDEPTVGMDATAQQHFWQQIRAWQASGKTVIITSHYLTEIQDVADRILFLRQGELSFQGTFQELQQAYQQVEISFQTTLPVMTFTSLSGVTAATKQQQTVYLSTEDSDATMAALAPNMGALHQLVVQRESLADIFIHLTTEAAS